MKLTANQQQTARNRAVATAQLAYKNRAGLHYSQDMARRWYGISQHKDASKGQWPSYADCSALVTWCIWNAVYLPYGMADIVNNSAWKAGYTGTMMSNGTRVSAASALIAGDAVMYSGHTAIVVGKSGSTPMVISHGSESGPHYVAYNYRSDILGYRRYIDGAEHAASNAPSPAPTPTPTMGDAVSIAPVVKKNGAIVVFAQKQDGTVMQAYQTGENQGWSGAAKGKRAAWYNLGNPGK